MKRLLQCFLALLLLCVIPASAADIYVSTLGSDLNDGSKEKPLATLTAALHKARELRRLKDPSLNNGIRIYILEGRYFADQTIIIRPEDSGTPENPTIIEGVKGGKVIISGGTRISAWKKLDFYTNRFSPTAKGKLWVATLPVHNGNTIFRQLWVNDKKAIRAKSMNGESMDRILSWDKKEQSCWIPTPKTGLPSNIRGTEMFIHQWWAIAVLRISKVEVKGDSTKLFFRQPESKIQSEHPWPAPWISKETGNSAFYLQNAIEFLDEPGEWFLDETNQKIYYWPREGEQMDRAEVIAPQTETLVSILGTIDQPVTNIQFNNISFQHSNWSRPSLYGHVPHQAGMYMTEAYKLRPAGTALIPTLDNQAWVGRPAASVAVYFAQNIKIEDCSFEHLAANGLDYAKAVKNASAMGCSFTDIGGTAVLAGVFSEEGQEIHLPYLPKDDREICERITVTNNLVNNVSNEDWSCPGIGYGYVRQSSISNNDISEVSNTAVSMGWGWTSLPNAMKENTINANRIYRYGKHNYDCSGIYTLSAQPNSVISNNYIDSIYKAPYAHLPSHWFYLYTDEGSSGFTVKNNWTPSTKFLQNANGPGNSWENNGPMADASIKSNAGLQKEFTYLLDRRSHSTSYAINKEHSEIIELILKKGETIDISKLKLLLHANQMDSAAIYKWQDHYVIFSKVNDLGVMQGRIQNNFPQTTVKVYHDLFYEFNRSRCADTTTAKEWSHIILTANLVENKKLQDEYLAHHATQFSKWPELSKGFCNALFQQLLIFRNGRQLVLVISIPKGESLDRLNPKTTENNPRVNDWNKLMQQYQEGIPGTKKGETWVFLEKI